MPTIIARFEQQLIRFLPRATKDPFTVAHAKTHKYDGMHVGCDSFCHSTKLFVQYHDAGTEYLQIRDTSSAYRQSNATYTLRRKTDMGIGIMELLVVAGIGVAGLVGVVILFVVVRAAAGNGNRKSHDSK